MTIFHHRKVNLIVCVLVALFGIGSWVDTNGLWVELPVMVPHLPEGWKLPSYMSVIIQMANIGPLFVTIMYVCFEKRMNERLAVYAVLGIGAISCLLISFFWKQTTYVGGEEHSTALLVLQFFLALTDCTTSVLFLPFMASFKAEYMMAYFIGEGLSGLLPSLVALGQGVGQLTCTNASSLNVTSNQTTFSIQPVYHDIRFSIEEFFYFLFVMLVISIISFTILNYTPYCKKEKAKHQADYKISNDQVADGQADNASNKGVVKTSNEYNSNKSSMSSKSLKKVISTQTFVLFLFITAWVNCLSNGALPSLQTYSCLPFGNEAYHLSATLGNIANPVACLVAFFITVKSSKAISVLTVLGSGIAGFLIYLAGESPKPILYNTTEGAVIAVAAWVLAVFTLTFVKVSIADAFRKEGKKGMLWVGAISQVGSGIGAVITFLLVNVYEIFESAPACWT